MKAVGIVCEYNPFHKGHLYHIDSVKRILGNETVIICVMSGDFVQRGEPAIISKYARAETAVRCGADLVVELPSIWSLQSAEGFAFSAVSILNDLGISYLSFGTEADDISVLNDISNILLSEDYRVKLKKKIESNKNIPFYQIRGEVISSYNGDYSSIISKPNNILAIEYISALNNLNSQAIPIAIQRIGSPHDVFAENEIRSANQIRNRIINNEFFDNDTPSESCSIIKREICEGKAPLSLDKFSDIMLSRLRMLETEHYLRIKDCNPDLGKRLYNAVRDSCHFSETLEVAKTRKYTLARIKRIYFCAAMGIFKEYQESAPSFIRILAANKRGCSYLAKIHSDKILVKPASITSFTEIGSKMFKLNSSIHDFYALASDNEEEKKCGNEYRKSPIII